MAKRITQENQFTYLHPLRITTGTADNTLASSVFCLAPPSDGNLEVIDWGIKKQVAGTGTAIITATLRKFSAGAAVAGTLAVDLDAAAGTENTAEGNGTKIAAGERLELDLNFDGGTATGAAELGLWIRFRR